MKTIYLLTGENEVYKNEFVDGLIKDVSRDDITIYYADEANANVIFNQCIQNSLFGSQNVVIVRNVDNMKKTSSENHSSLEEFTSLFSAYIKNPNPDTMLIVEWKDPSKKIQNEFTGRKDLEIKNFRKAYEREVESYIRRKFGEEKIGVDEETVDLIVELANGDIETVSMYIKLLTEYAGDDGTISYEDTKAALSRAGNAGIFDFLEAFFSKDARKSLITLSDMKLDKNSSVIAVNAMIMKTAQNLWGYLALRNKPNLEELLGIKRGQLHYLRQYARFVDLKFVSEVINLASDVEIKSKTMPEDFAYLQIEAFILENMGAR
jgi:DNA polymerase III delta subunit